MKRLMIVIDIHGTPHEVSQGTRPEFDVLARRSGSRFFVLASNEGDLFNPLDRSNKINEKDRNRGGLFWNLKGCSQECYQQYITFLRSKNKTPYLLAQRRFSHDI